MHSLNIRKNKYKKEKMEARRLDFADGERDKKKIELEQKTKELKEYKTLRGVVDVKASSEALVGQQKELEMDKEKSSNKTVALNNSIRQLNSDIASLRKNKTL